MGNFEHGSSIFSEVQEWWGLVNGGAWSTLTGRSVVHFKPTRKLTSRRQPKKSPAEQCLSFSSAYVQSVALNWLQKILSFQKSWKDEEF